MTTGMKMTMLVMIMMEQKRSLAKESQSEEMAAGTEKGEIAVEAKLKRFDLNYPLPFKTFASRRFVVLC